MTTIQYNGNVAPDSNQVVDYDLPNGKLQLRMVTNPIGLPAGSYKILSFTFENQLANNIFQICFDNSNNMWMRNNTSVNTWTTFNQFMIVGPLPITAPDRAILFNNAGTVQGLSTLLYTTSGDVSVAGTLRAIASNSALLIGPTALQPSGTPTVSIRTLTSNGGVIFPTAGSAAQVQFQSYIQTSSNTDLFIFGLPTNGAAYFEVRLVATSPVTKDQVMVASFMFNAKSDSVAGLTIGPVTIIYTLSELTGVSYSIVDSGGSVAIRSVIAPSLSTQWNCNATVYPSGIWP